MSRKSKFTPNGNKTADTSVSKSGTAWEGYDIGTYEMSTKNFDNAYEEDGDYESSSGYSYNFYSFYSEIIGTSANNEIKGNGDLRVLYVNGGDKDLYLRGADDSISGYAGNDSIYGYEGNDTLHGGADDDILEGGEGEDRLLGGTGNDVLVGGDDTDYFLGGFGNDFLATGDLTNGETDYLHGGNGIDTFVLGESDSEISTSTGGDGLDWENLALSVAGDMSDLLFTVAANAAAKGTFFASAEAKVAKEIVPVVFDVVKAIQNEDVTTEIDPPNVAGYATIADFNFLEDVVIIPLADDGNPNVFISEDTNTENILSFKYDSLDSADIFATLNLESAYFATDFALEEYSDDNDMIDSIKDNLLDTALVIDSSGVSMGLNNGEAVTDLDIPDTLSSALSGMGTRFMVLGAYSGQLIDGSNDEDYIYGTNLNDTLSGFVTLETAETPSGTTYNPQNDQVDELYGFDGDDVFYGGAGNDFFYGGPGSDTVSYENVKEANNGHGVYVDLHNTGEQAGAGYIDPDTGNTYANNSELADDGFDGKDRLFSIENIIGGDFDDTIIADGTYGSDNTLAGRSGTDTVDYSNASGAVTVTFGEDVVSGDEWAIEDGEATTQSVSWTQSTATVANGSTDTLYSIENVIGTDYTDTADFSSAVGPVQIIINTDGTATIYESGLGDTYTLTNFEQFIGSYSSEDVVYFDPDVDQDDYSLTNIETIAYNQVLEGTSGDDTLNGATGDNTIYGYEGDDVITTTGVGDNIISGGEGDDSITAGSSGDDTIYVGEGNDTIKGSLFDQYSDRSTLGIDWDGVDTIDFEDGIYGVDVNLELFSGWAYDAFDGDNFIDPAYFGIDVVKGTSANDYIAVSRSDRGDFYETDVYGEEGHDTLIGSGQEQFIYGGEGNDFLLGLSSSDTLTGGEGADTFVYSLEYTTGLTAVSGTDIITDFDPDEDMIRITEDVFDSTLTESDLSYDSGTGELSADGTVLAILENLPTGFSIDSHVELIEDSSDRFVDDDPTTLNPRVAGHTAGYDTGTTTSSGDDSLTFTSADETIDGLHGNDFIQAGDGADDVSGSEGNDTLLGEGGADILTGGLHNDSLVGGEGNDTLIGVDDSSTAPGVDELDTLVGGNDSDVFVLGNASAVFYDDPGTTGADGDAGAATISDFEVGTDLIQLNGSTDDYALLETNGNTKIIYTAGAVVDLIGTVENVTGLDLIDYTEFSFV